jgi:cytochrome P450
MATQQLVNDLAGEARLDDPEFYLRSDRFSTYARLRREAPVFWCESAGSWVLSKHADIAWAERRGNPPLTTREGLFIREAKRPDLIAARDPGGAQVAGGGFHSDPPQHTQFRRPLNGSFLPGKLSELEPMIRALADELLDELPENEPVDFVHAFSAPLAIGVISEFLGVPRETWRDIWRWTDAQQDMIGGGFPEGSPEALQAAEDMAEMRAYFTEQLAERARAPREDFMSTVAAIELDGQPLPAASQLQAAGAVARVGNDTTRNLLAGAMATFVEHPEQWEKLIADPTLVPSATEELLRWVGPVIHFGRRATQPVVIRDQPIAAGDFLIMLFDSGNRDEDVWPDADTFDVTRGVHSPHLGFGLGIHRCVGAPLARLEIHIALEGLIKRFRSWELAGPPVRIPSTLVHTYRQLPVVLTRR